MDATSDTSLHRPREQVHRRFSVQPLRVSIGVEHVDAAIVYALRRNVIRAADRGVSATVALEYQYDLRQAAEMRAQQLLIEA
ncbi:MAG: hypothetical protein R6V07_08415 [Armatimonadota bacterium]